ncbi:MAG: RAD55 family ATPase [Candidatus Thermoplasmatota archaeon]|nr:RAD55 family ATPase [Candidatus Thermoplasmatota archaeon]
MNEVISEIEEEHSKDTIPIQREFVSTGVQKLDDLLGGGFQKGFTTLISAIPGTNIEIFTKQLATTDDPIYISTDETKEEIIDTMQSFFWDPSGITFEDISKKHLDYVRQGESKRISIYQQRSRTMIKELIREGSQGIPAHQSGEEDYLAILSHNFREHASRKIIVNNLDFFLERYQTNDVIHTIKAGKLSVSQHRGVLIIILTRGIHGTQIERNLEALADCILELDVIQKGTSFERLLSVKKIKNYAKKIGTARYEINDQGFILENIERIL